MIIKLVKQNATLDAEGNVTDWTPALIAVAQEVQALNAYSGTEVFPYPIPCNPLAERVEELLGENTLPSANGHVLVQIHGYDSLESYLFPAVPTTFTYTWGSPAGVGQFI